MASEVRKKGKWQGIGEATVRLLVTYAQPQLLIGVAKETLAQTPPPKSFGKEKKKKRLKIESKESDKTHTQDDDLQERLDFSDVDTCRAYITTANPQVVGNALNILNESNKDSIKEALKDCGRPANLRKIESPGAFCESILQLMSVIDLHNDAHWVSSVGEDVRKRLQLDSTEEINNEQNKSMQPKHIRTFTPRHLALLCWALGDKGKLVQTNVPWVVLVSRSLVSTLLEPSRHSEVEELCGIAQRIQHMSIVRDIVWPVLVQLSTKSFQSSEFLKRRSLLKVVSAMKRLDSVGIVDVLQPPEELVRILSQSIHAATWSETHKTLRYLKNEDFLLMNRSVEDLTCVIEKHLKEMINSTCLDIDTIASLSELLAATNTLSSTSENILNNMIMKHVQNGKQHITLARDARIKANWCLHMAGAGFSNNEVFSALADAVLSDILSPPQRALSRMRRSSKGRWIPDVLPLKPTKFWLVKVATLMAASGESRPDFFKQIAQLASQTTDNEEQAALLQMKSSEEHGEELDTWFHRGNKALDEMKEGVFSYFSDLPMLLMHKADSAMHGFMTTKMILPEWDVEINLQKRVDEALSFDDKSLPLFIDLGCGRGSFLLGVAKEFQKGVSETMPRCGKMNFLGVERSPYLIRKACGIAKRWGLQGTVRFVHGSAQKVIEYLIKHKQAAAGVVSVQYPTPFPKTQTARKEDVTPLSTKSNHNPHLPQLEDNGFLVTPSMSRAVLKLLLPGGVVFLQSDSEDVAVKMRETFLEHDDDCLNAAPSYNIDGFSAFVCPQGFKNAPVQEIAHHKRTLRSNEYLAGGGVPAEGAGWLPCNPWSAVCRARTETEAACNINNIRVYRCFLQKV
eukprot:m.6683 g.6683  ORF g.6683 m.6683 type:complete len:854 (+) comp3568_c0_seq1:216-2777(+)